MCEGWRAAALVVAETVLVIVQCLLIIAFLKFVADFIGP